MNRIALSLGLTLAGIAAPAVTMAGSVSHYHADLVYFSMITSSSADLTLDGNQLTVHLLLNGVDPSGSHAVHINGFTSPNQQSHRPGTSQDTNRDNFLEANEAEATYGPALLNLGTFSTSTSVLEFTQTYDLTDNSIYANNGSATSLLPLELREIVVDGGSTATADGGPAGSVRGFVTPGSGTFDPTVPVAWGEIKLVPAAVPLPAAVWSGLGMLLTLGGIGCLRRRKMQAA